MTQDAISRRPTLATSLLLALSSLFLIDVFHALFSIAGYAIEQLHDAQSELRQTSALVNESGRLQAELMAMDEVAIRRRLQTGDSASSAIGILQSNVNQLVRESDLQLDSMAAELPQIKGPITKLTIVLKSSGSEAALLRLLAAIEKQDTFIVIERLTVVAQELAVVANAPPTPSVSIEMRTSAYWTAPVPGRERRHEKNVTHFLASHRQYRDAVRRNQLGSNPVLVSQAGADCKTRPRASQGIVRPPHRTDGNDGH